ncbi:MAG: acetate--CoA ligase family protein [Desulfococcaceae bacterium]
MDFFFEPRGIALVGATGTPTKGGYAILKNLMTGFDGGIYPVNPRYPEIEGLPCYGSVSQVPDPVDLAIVFVPARLVPGVIRDCADRGIRGVMIESGGFAETGEQGKALQEEVAEIAKTAGIRLWGPNCMGLVDTKKRRIFSFVTPTIWNDLETGEVSLIVQSGMLSGAFLIDSMTHGTMGISKVCSIGNKMDVDECELLEYLIDDPDTGAIGLYLEAIPEGRRFMEICRRSPKPIVVLKGGRSPKGAAAARSHTASLAGDDRVVAGALAQAGVIQARDFKQMMDICRALSMYPEIQTGGRGRVAVLTYTGGAGIVSADFIDEMALELADLSPITREALKSVFPDWMPVSNPVDLWPAVERNGAEAAFGTAVEAVCADSGVDAVFLHAFAGGFALDPNIEFLAGVAKSAGKPLFCWLLGDAPDAKDFQTQTQALGVPVYREVHRALECMEAVFVRKRMSKTRAFAFPFGEPLPLDSKAASLLEIGGGVLDEYDSKIVLRAAGVPVVTERVVKSAQEAGEAATRLEFPVVMKGLVPGGIHKTESGLVRLGIDSAEAAVRGFDELNRIMEEIGEETGGETGKVLIQQQVEPGLELIAGFLRDPQFGPCVMIGFGGVLAEVLNDVVFGVAPLSREEALHLLDRLKSRRLLDGYRGAPAADRGALADILTSLGGLGSAYPGIREIDINPLILSRGKPVAVDATLILKS